MSAFVDNIPFTATMLPITAYLTKAIPGAAESNVLWWALALGVCLGGNGTIIGASANVVTVGIAEAVLLKAGVSEGLISTRVVVGTPAEEILKEAEEADYHLIIVGRKGRTALKDLILGGVSSTILQRCQNPTVAIVSSR
jgi:nucleotide-binding universal stress UspA family protein